MGRMNAGGLPAVHSAVAGATDLGTPRAPGEVEVLAAKRITPRTLELVLARADGRAVRYQPGHFCNLAIPGPGGKVWRSYSLSTPLCAGEAVSRFEVVAGAVPGGRATEYLFALRPGDRMRTSGPFGRLLLPAEDPAHYVLVGTGTGLAPYRAMLPELARRAAVGNLRVSVVAGVRSPLEALYLEEFRAFAAAEPMCRHLHVRYSRELPATPEPGEDRGYVQDALPTVDPSPAGTLVYLCGNPGMIDVAADWLAAAGFASRSVIREKYQSRPARG